MGVECLKVAVFLSTSSENGTDDHCCIVQVQENSEVYKLFRFLYLNFRSLRRHHLFVADFYCFHRTYD